MKKSALFFDIDGTILSEITKEIPESALEALNQAKTDRRCISIQDVPIVISHRSSPTI